MRAFYCNDFDGVFVRGTAVVVAEGPEQARVLMDQKLKSEGLHGLDDHNGLEELDLSKPNAVVIDYGNP